MVLPASVHGRGVPPGAPRLPPGQYVTNGFPLLSAGPTPHTPLTSWTFSVQGAVRGAQSWTWEEFRALPREAITVDIHCVTTWSKFHDYGDPWQEQRYRGD